MSDKQPIGDECDYSLLPGHLQEGMRQYIEYGRLPGSFLCAVLRNDFMQAATRADVISAQHLREIAQFLTTTPAPCHGSPEKVEAWCLARKKGGGA